MVQEIKQQTQTVPAHAIEGPAAWYGRDLRDSAQWVTILSPGHLQEIDRSVQQLISTPEEQLHQLTADDYGWSAGLKAVLQEALDQIVSGRGFVILRGLPAGRYNLKELVIAYWGIVRQLGNVQVTSKHGHLIGHVADHGNDPKHPLTRLYSTSAAQPFHCDRAADIIGLCCVHTAQEGGLSSWTSSVTVINEMLKSRPDLVEALMQPVPTDRKGEIPTGKGPTYLMPIVHVHKGLLTVNYGGEFIKSAQQNFLEAPRLTPQQEEAMQLLEETAAREDLRLDFDLQPGDVQLIHNHTILHARGAFKDFGEAGKRRHLLRTWISPSNGRPLPEVFAEQWASMEKGNRGGIRVPGVQPHISLDATK